MENSILKNKAKEFIIIFGKSLVRTLIIVSVLAFAIVPCIIVQTVNFIILWMIFTISLYVTIWNVFLDPFKEIEE